MDELLPQFLLEGRDLVAHAHAALIALGRDAANGAALDELFRATHTLKGSVALFDMNPAEMLLHAAETRLDRARKSQAPLDEAALDLLMAVIDQSDRWIDQMEKVGSLSPDAAGQADQLALLLEEGDKAEPSAALPSQEQPDWLTTLRERPQFSGLDPMSVRTAFRYTPDVDCFFRGEDPLAMAAAVPELQALAVLPAAETWPDLSACEPFQCMAVIEGISNAEEEAVRSAFRLAPDQIAIAPLAAPPLPAWPDETSPPEETVATLRIEAKTLDRLADQSGELAVTIGALEPILVRLRALDSALAADLGRARDAITRVAATMQRTVSQVRLVPIEPVLRRLPRLAREAAATLGKAIRFTLDGQGARIDKQLADQLFEPLLHLVRNAVDHGIESVEQRVSSGKPPEGQLGLSVRQDSNSVTFILTDDGRGIDPAALRKAAVTQGAMSTTQAQALSDAETMEVIFLPGFSTSKKATALSGRGVGMDAVKASVERLSGTVSVESRPGEGTSITLMLPAHAITTPLLVVEAGGRAFGVRLDQIVETRRIAAREIQPLGQGHACVLRDRTVPVQDLATLLGLAPTTDDLARLVVADAGACRLALRVERFGTRLEAVIRESTGLVAAMPAIAGTAMTADGSILLVLDLPELLS